MRTSVCLVLCLQHLKTHLEQVVRQFQLLYEEAKLYLSLACTLKASVFPLIFQYFLFVLCIYKAGGESIWHLIKVKLNQPLAATFRKTKTIPDIFVIFVIQQQEEESEELLIRFYFWLNERKECERLSHDSHQPENLHWIHGAGCKRCQSDKRCVLAVVR